MALEPIRFTHDPDATLDYTLDWSAWLDGDTISASTWLAPTSPPNPPTASRPAFTTTTTTVWIAGGNNGQTYKFTNRITTSGGRIEDRSVIFEVKHK